jgi:hypothetical protein
MLPDLRFVLGAMIATVLLGVTLFGMAATMHISHQSKIGPLESSRMLAFTPEVRHRVFDLQAPRADSPFANIPADPNPVPLQQPAGPAEPEAPPVQAAAAEQPATRQPSIAQPASLPAPADDADTVDERAVVEPPLPLDNDAPAEAADSAPVAPSPEPAAANPPIETISAPTAPVVEAPAEPVAAPDVQQVASIPTTTTDAAPETPRNVATITEAREAPKAKHARKTAKAKRPVRRAAAAAPQPATLFPLGPSPILNANRPAIGFWPLD